jgi:hypothetical protein
MPKRAAGETQMLPFVLHRFLAATTPQALRQFASH